MALEWTISGVFTVMPGQLVRTGKFPPAAFPGTVVGLFPSVGPQVSLQVAAFSVGLHTPGVSAGVVGLTLPTPCTSAALLRLGVVN